MVVAHFSCLNQPAGPQRSQIQEISARYPKSNLTQQFSLALPLPNKILLHVILIFLPRTVGCFDFHGGTVLQQNLGKTNLLETSGYSPISCPIHFALWLSSALTRQNIDNYPLMEHLPGANFMFLRNVILFKR